MIQFLNNKFPILAINNNFLFITGVSEVAKSRIFGILSLIW